MLGQCKVRVGIEGVAAAESASAWGSDASAASGTAWCAVVHLIDIGGHGVVGVRVVGVVVGTVGRDDRQSAV